ncbi:WRKY domain containing protein [Trema orientale]|uniref:WRKY domain containing protein n=1 Tax=Trema orientale TaxID=63057 RepID=A0A2P5D1L7_TREOI|nr:WRKY domain containing protein [Trema orientale]
MAVDFMGYRSENFSAKLEESAAVKEAASGLESVEKLIRLLSQTPAQAQAQDQTSTSSCVHNHQREMYQPPLEIEMDCRAVADVAVSKFRRVISLLSRTRTGHARFRRGPLAAQAQAQAPVQEKPSSETRVYYATPIQQIPPQAENGVVIPKSRVIDRKDSSSTTINFSYSSAATSFMSSLTGDSDSQKPSLSSPAFQITNLSQVSSAGKPPLSTTTSLKRKCSSETLGSGKCASGSSGRCHCTKKRKMRMKRVVRVPAISLKMADIPPDDYSWRKYGQKPIKGSPHPRGYYKCSSVRGCPARKHVERALDDPSMLVVTYEGEHNHSLSVAEASNLILESS